MVEILKKRWKALVVALVAVGALLGFEVSGAEADALAEGGAAAIAALAGLWVLGKTLWDRVREKKRAAWGGGALLVILALALQGCALVGIGAAETPGQTFYETRGAWNTVKSLAAAWAESPAGQARPEVLDEFVKIDERVEGILAEAKTALFDLPPGAEKDGAFDRYAHLILLGTQELRALLIREGVEGVR